MIRNTLCPGDAVALWTACLNLHHAYPNKWKLSVDNIVRECFAGHPILSPPKPHYIKVTPRYNGSLHSAAGMTFAQSYTQGLAHALGIPIPCVYDRPALEDALTPLERDTVPFGLKDTYVIVNAGWKNDATVKAWGGYQRLVDLCPGIQFVQVGELSRGHHHPLLTGNVVDLRGKTSARQLMVLTYHAAAVVCGITFLAHMAAAMNTQAFVLCGGREHGSWLNYSKQRYYDTRPPALACAKPGGCWASRVVPINDGDKRRNDNCCKSVIDGLPECMRMIRPETVANDLAQYLSTHAPRIG